MCVRTARQVGGATITASPAVAGTPTSMTATVSSLVAFTEYMYTLDAGDGSAASTCSTIGMADATGGLSAITTYTYKVAGSVTATLKLYPRFPLTTCPEGKTPAADAKPTATATAKLTVRPASY